MQVLLLGGLADGRRLEFAGKTPCLPPQITVEDVQYFRRMVYGYTGEAVVYCVEGIDSLKRLIERYPCKDLATKVYHPCDQVTA